MGVPWHYWVLDSAGDYLLLWGGSLILLGSRLCQGLSISVGFPGTTRCSTLPGIIYYCGGSLALLGARLYQGLPISVWVSLALLSARLCQGLPISVGVPWYYLVLDSARDCLLFGGVP